MSEESIQSITKSSSNFHILPDMNFNGHCLIKNRKIRIKKQNIPKNTKNVLIYFLNTRSTIKKFKHIFYIS